MTLYNKILERIWDKAEKREKIGKEILFNFFRVYDEAEKSPYIRKPISYSLYRMWKIYDANEEEREVEE